MPLISRDKKIVWLGIPRTSTTSMESFLRKNVDDKFNGHKHKILKSKLDNHFHFTFVRDPYDRMVSLFGWYNQLRKGRRGISVNDFLREMNTSAAYKGHGKDFHWITQTEYCYKDSELIYDFVGKFENLGEDLSILSKRLDVDFSSYPKLYSTKKTHDLMKNLDFIESVNRVFEDDFKNFNYKIRRL